MAEPSHRRRWPQFGLKSLLLVTVVCAVATAWWRQWKQNAELTAMQKKLQQLKAESEYQDNFLRVFRELDLDSPKHRQALEIVQIASWGFPLGSVQKRAIGGAQSGREVLVFHFGTRGSAVTASSAVVLLQREELLDLIVRQSNTRLEWHEVLLEEPDDKGNVEVVFNCLVGFRAEPSRIVYRVSNRRFEKLEQPRQTE